MRQDAMDEDIQIAPQMGFAAAIGEPGPPRSRHECQYNPFPNTSPYYKRGDTERAFMTIGCQCGSTKEVCVQDLRPNA